MRSEAPGPARLTLNSRAAFTTSASCSSGTSSSVSIRSILTFSSISDLEGVKKPEMKAPWSRRMSRILAARFRLFVHSIRLKSRCLISATPFPARARWSSKTGRMAAAMRSC